MKGDRLDRVNALIKNEIANFLKINSQRDSNIVVNSVIVSPDLKNAKVFLTWLMGKIRVNSLNYLKPKIAKYLSHKVKLKYLPKIKFYPINPSTIDRLESIYEQIEHIQKKQQK